jgi:signal transduction histidine kinase
MAHAVNSKAKQKKTASLDKHIDTAEPKQSGQAIKEVQLSIQGLLEIVREPLIALDADLKVISANRSFYETFNLEPKETQGQLIFDLDNNQWDIPKLREFLEEELRDNNTLFNFEVEHKLENNGPGILVLNGQRVMGYGDNADIFLLSIKNITGKNKLMEEDEQSFTYLKETLESTDDGILVIDIGDKIKVSNHRFIELFGIPEHLIASRDFNKVMKFVMEQLIDSTRFLEIANELNTNHFAECFDIIETNRNTTLEFYSKPQRIDDEIVGRVWSFRDITTQKWAEKALKITYISFHNILESSKDGIIVVDDRGCVCFFNLAAETMFQGKVDDRLSKRLGFSIKAGETREIAIERLDGDLGVAEMRVVETEWEGKSAFLAMFRDITDRKHAEEKLKRHQEHLEEKVKQRTNELIQAEKMVALGQLVSGVAHEVNNPLAFIRSNTEFMKDVILNLKDTFKEKDMSMESLDEIEDLIRINIDGINRISSITSALKRFAKPGAEEKSGSDINQGIKDTLLIVGNKLKHRITVHEEYAELPKVMCNIEQLNQVFMNVILNAAEAMDKGNLNIKTWNANGYIFIEIQDDGKGIPEAELNKIFDPFFTTKDDGTGLGLSLSYRIIQAHGGTIKAESEVGAGTKIKIKIPMGNEND